MTPEVANRCTAVSVNWIQRDTAKQSLAHNPTFRCTFRVVSVTTDQYTDPSQDQGLALDPANSSLMQYAGGNPVNVTDPTGHIIDHGGGRTTGIGYGGRRYVNQSGNAYGSRSGGSYSYSYSAAASAAVAKAAARKAKRRAEQRAIQDRRNAKIQRMRDIKIARMNAIKARQRFAANLRGTRTPGGLHMPGAGQGRSPSRGVVISPVCATGYYQVLTGGAGGQVCPVSIGISTNGLNLGSNASVMTGVGPGLGAIGSLGPSVNFGTGNANDLGGTNVGALGFGAAGPGLEGAVDGSMACGIPSVSVGGAPTAGAGAAGVATLSHTFAAGTIDECS